MTVAVTPTSGACAICATPLVGARRLYCGDRCKWRANNARRDPAAESTPDRVAQKQAARQRYRERQAPGERKYPSDPDWRKRPRAPRSGGITREEAERRRKLRHKRQKYLRRARGATVATIRFSPDELEARFAFWGHRCWVCGCRGDMQIDHVKPLSKGGPNMLSNHRPICGACNSSKSAKWPFLETRNAPAFARRGVR